jgi:hypothetical protein
MKLLKRTTVVLALGFAAAGCSNLDTKQDSSSVAREDLRNAQGHVVGYKDVMRDGRTGEELAQIGLYVPRLDSRGDIVGYEERVRGGTILRDLNGRKMGGRFNDVRSRANNPTGGGLMIIVRGKDSQRATLAAAPSIDELIALAKIN